ncbi:MAG: hypothetical protein KDC38_00355, partial [Planctomycetes bacterium]|nr:hypothetical protein [Planctomycetota bacterium]
MTSITLDDDPNGETSVPRSAYLSEWRWIVPAIAVGLVARLLVAAYGGPLSHDAAAFYLPNARALVTGGLGNWEAMSIAVPPLFPTLVALLEPLFGDIEFAAYAISIVS